MAAWMETARALARKQGCLVGTSAGANVWAAIHVACEKTKGNVITILPDRAGGRARLQDVPGLYRQSAAQRALHALRLHGR